MISKIFMIRDADEWLSELREAGENAPLQADQYNTRCV